MLVLHLRADDYLTIGDDIVVKVDRVWGEQVSVAISAPREVPIVRGSVLERSSERPECLDKPPKRSRTAAR